MTPALVGRTRTAPAPGRRGPTCGSATELLTRPPGPSRRPRPTFAVAIQKAQEVQAQAQAPSDATTAWATIQPSLVLVSVALASGSGTGAGVIVKADGTILTANHVVAGARSVTVSSTGW